MTSEREFRRLVELVGIYHDEADRCARAGCFRAACVMIAATLEAGLLALVLVFEEDLRRQGLWPQRKNPPDRWPLTVLVGLARRARWLPAQVEGEGIADVDAITEAEVDELVKFVSDVRNMAAHPGGYMRKSREIPDIELDQAVYENAYEIVRTAFDHTYVFLKREPHQDTGRGSLAQFKQA